MRLAFLGLFAWLCFGMFLELLLFLEAGFYLDDPLLRQLWSLAHAHGTLSWMLYMLYCVVTARLALPRRIRRWGRLSCAAGASLLPMGFFLGAIGHGSQHPSWGIVLVPIGGLFLACAVLLPVMSNGKPIIDTELTS